MSREGGGPLTLTKGQVAFVFPLVDAVIVIAIRVGQEYLEKRPSTRITHSHT